MTEAADQEFPSFVHTVVKDERGDVVRMFGTTVDGEHVLYDVDGAQGYVDGDRGERLLREVVAAADGKPA